MHQKFDSQSDPRKRFLDLFPTYHRSTIANRFYYAVRNGCIDIAAVVVCVVGESRRLRDDGAVRIIQENPAAAHEFADYAIEWEQLPHQVKHKIKQQKSEIHKEEYLRTQPPTDKQIKYLKALGYSKEVKSK